MERNILFKLVTDFPHIIDIIVHYSYGDVIESLIKIKNVKLINLLVKYKSIKNFICSLKDCCKKVKNDWYGFKNIDGQYQTPEICLAAVQQNGYALEYVKEQTPVICLDAVQKNELALQFVKEQTPIICMAAVI